MTLFLCIDDTDEIGTKGTGELAEELATIIEGCNWGQCSAVTRHQLYVHDDIPYTSHNSAMCFEIENHANPEAIQQLASEFLLKHAAPGSDPGLCLYQYNEQTKEALIRFGIQAKVEVLNKAQAYQVAKDNGALLTEHGGTGDGVIGALAGIGLRMQGCDGRLKGQLQLDKDQPRYTVFDLLQHPLVDRVMDQHHHSLRCDLEFELKGKLKAIRWQHQNCVILVQENNYYHNAQKQHLKRY
ncbi:DNA-binding protein [Ferrimonas aestuarii]|uniref:DNA-binding protein n=1 Tax=Ferrimonas aestuarii TaxID=2569539 RepID=A0A4U1BPI7_9GAMM|nr:DNA-binding protein [Ferrimonas aestuarii]TKB56118.1 DNA-binding protein [Ferrimonas aestuarii]